MGELLEKAVEARAQLHDVISLTDVKTRVDMQRYPAFPPILPPSPSFDYHFILRTRSYHVISPYCFHPSPFCFAPCCFDGVYGRECPTDPNGSPDDHTLIVSPTHTLQHTSAESHAVDWCDLSGALLQKHLRGKAEVMVAS